MRKGSRSRIGELSWGFRTTFFASGFSVCHELFSFWNVTIILSNYTCCSKYVYIIPSFAWSINIITATLQEMSIHREPQFQNLKKKHTSQAEQSHPFIRLSASKSPSLLSSFPCSPLHPPKQICFR